MARSPQKAKKAESKPKEPMPGRDATGRFLPGAPTINPGGRPRDLEGVRKLIRERGPELLERLMGIALGEATQKRKSPMTGTTYDAKPSFREQTQALEVVLSYWLGKPPAHVTLEGAAGDALSIAAAREAAAEVLRDAATRIALRLAIRREEGAGNTEVAPKVLDAPETKPGPLVQVDAMVASPVLPDREQVDWFADLLTECPRIAITGGPGAGKTTLSNYVTDRVVLHTDDYQHMEWSEASRWIAGCLCGLDRFIVEGVRVPHALRKDMQVDAIVWLKGAHKPLTDKQAAMAKAVRTVHDEVVMQGWEVVEDNAERTVYRRTT